MVKPVLYFYAGKRGEAEAIRMMFKEMGEDFDEVACQEGELPQMADEGLLLFGRLPMVSFGDLNLVEQPAILEHIASSAGHRGVRGNKYLGENEEERSTARALCSAAQELRHEVLEYAKTKDKGAQDRLKTVVIPEWFSAIDKLATSSCDEDRGLGAGIHFTFGDLAMLEVINAISVLLRTSILRPYPSLKQWHDKGIARPAIEAHLAQRPDADW